MSADKHAIGNGLRHAHAALHVCSSVLALAFGTAGANAQTSDPATPPKVTFVDEVGVNLQNGQIDKSLGSLAIGPKDNPALNYSVLNTMSGPGRFTPLDGGIYFACYGMSQGGTYIPCAYYSDQYKMGERFEWIDLTYKQLPADTQDGSHVSNTSSATILTERNGTKWAYTGQFANKNYKYGNTQNGWQEVAKLMSVTYPTGETLTYAYDPVPSGTSPAPAALRSVTSSLGYQIHLDGPWARPLKVTLINLAYDYCDPHAAGCTGLTHKWPQASVTYDARGGAVVTDSAGRVTSFSGWQQVSTTVARAVITSPTGITYTADQEVKGVAGSESNGGTGGCPGTVVTTRVNSGGADWLYSYSLGTTQTYCGVVGSVTVTAPDGSHRSFSGSAGTHVLSDGLGRSTTYVFPTVQSSYNGPVVDLDTGVRSVKYQEANKADYAYDSRFNVTSVTSTPKSGAGPVTAFTGSYDTSCSSETNPACDKPIYTLDALNSRTDYTYHQPSGLVATMTKPPGANGVRPQTRYYYKQYQANYYVAAGQKVASGQPVWKLDYTSTCQTQASCTGTADEVVTRYAYDDNLLPIATTVATGDGSASKATTVRYNEVGDVVTTDGPMPGAADTTYFYYDDDREPVGTVRPDPDGAGPLQFPATRMTYNGDGLPIREEVGVVAAVPASGTAPANWSGFAVGKQTDTSYDLYGRKSKDTVSAGGQIYSVVQYSYDALSRLQCTAVRMDPTQWNNQPDTCVPQTSGPDGPDRITRNVYDAGGQLTTVQKAYGTSLQQNYVGYTYTPNGKQASVTDADGNVSAMTYDGFDRQVSWAFPSKANGAATASCSIGTVAEVNGISGPSETRGAGDDCEKYAYDRNDNRATLMKRDGSIIRYGYDPLNRVTRKDVPSSASGAPGYSVSYGYDLRGLQTSAMFANGPGITNLYDGFGQLASTTTNMDGTSRTLNSHYDADGNRIWLDAPSYVIRWGYDGLDRATSVMQGDGSQVAQFGYDATGRRSSLGLGPLSGNNSPSNVGYGYDPIGRLQSLGHSFASASAAQILGFGYNPASQIVSRTSSNDAYASTTAYNVNRPYTVNGLNQYTAAGSASFGYDANGNLTGDGSSTFVYDAENRLVSASGAKKARLSYDPMGRLWQVQSPSATTRFVYDGDHLLQEYDGSGNLSAEYAYGPGEDEPLVWYDVAHGNPRRYLHANHEGSVISLADDNGNPSYINAYDEWGIPNPNNQGRFQYTGQAYLPDLGMYYYKARIYSPTLGRFLQTDPIGYKDQINLYAYVANDPVNGRDPSGMFGCGSGLKGAACDQFKADQAAAAKQLTAAVKTVRSLASDLAAGRKLNGAERAMQASINKYQGAGTGSDAKFLGKFAAEGDKIIGALNSNFPVQPHGQTGTDFASAPTGLVKTGPAYIFPNYYNQSANTRQETWPHEGAHFSLGARDWAYGSAAAARLARDNPGYAQNSADNIALGFGFDRDN